MAKISRQAGTTSHVLTIFIQDATSTTGAGLTGLAFGSALLTCYYKQNRGTASVAVTLVNITTLGTYVSGGFKEIDATGMPGFYEFHPPNAALAATAGSVAFALKGALNMVPCPLEIELTGTDNQNATTGGIANLDAAISTRSTYAGADTAGTTTLLTRVPSAAALATQIPANFTTATFSSAGVFATAALANAPTTSLGSTAPAGWINTAAFAAGATLPVVTLATTATNLTNAPTAGDFTATMKTSLNASTPAGVAGAVGSVTAPVTAGTVTDKTGYSLLLTQAIPNSNTDGTVGDALNAARAQGFGKWAISGTTLNLYGSDGTTIVRAFTLDSATAPTQRS